MKMKKAIGFLVLGFFCASAVYAAGFPFSGKVNSDNINLRAEPSVNSESITRLKEGSRVKVIAERFDWYKICLPQNTICFVSRKYVKGGMITADKVNLRALPSESAAILGQVNKEEKVEIVKTELEWYGILAPFESAFGWVHKKFIDYYVEEIKRGIEPKEGNKEEKITPLACGIIKPMGIFYKRRGSHKLIIGGKIAYYLQSEDKSLLDNYSGYKANIFGKRIETPGQKTPLVTVEKVEIIQ